MPKVRVNHQGCSDADKVRKPRRSPSVVKFQVSNFLQRLFGGAPAQAIVVPKKEQHMGSSPSEISTETPDSLQSPRPCQITQASLDFKMDELARFAENWGADGRFDFVQTLQEAARNHGRVDLMKTKLGESVAVKRMPTKWITKGPKDFSAAHASSSERPWYDMGFIKTLNEQGFPHVCSLLGIFRDEENTFVAMALAEGGDLFKWCETGPPPGVEREATMLPIVVQTFGAVRYIHDVGLAHRDLSLENILLTTDPSGNMLVKLIDFGMATLKRFSRKEVRGKQSYQAPEMHTSEAYDGFLTDSFALGVVVFAMAAQDYPWQSTKQNSCQFFEYVRSFGLEKLLARRKSRKSQEGQKLIHVISPSLLQLLVGLLCIQPASRLSLGEQCFPKAEREGVWETNWIMTWRDDLDASASEQTQADEQVTSI